MPTRRRSLEWGSLYISLVRWLGQRPPCLNLLPSRSTPYLAPAAGAIISATALARSRAREWCEIRLTRVLNLEFRCRYVLVILPVRSGVFTDDPEGAKCVLQDTEMDEMPSSSACGNNSESARQPCLARSINACAALCSPGKSGARCQFVRPLLSATRPTGAINLRRNGKRLTS
jgi:hypothetical protein